MAVVVLPEPIIPSTKISCAAPTSQGYDAAASLRDSEVAAGPAVDPAGRVWFA
jgi:hypothetical protein